MPPFPDFVANSLRAASHAAVSTRVAGVIPLLQIVDCEYLPEKRVGCRFDVRVRAVSDSHRILNLCFARAQQVKNLRVYSLHGSGVDDAKQWTNAINEAMVSETCKRFVWNPCVRTAIHRCAPSRTQMIRL